MRHSIGLSRGIVIDNVIEVQNLRRVQSTNIKEKDDMHELTSRSRLLSQNIIAELHKVSATIRYKSKLRPQIQLNDLRNA